MVLPVSEKTIDYARKVLEQLKSAGLRAELDDSADKVGAKIRRATIEKTPYMLILGPKESTSDTVSVRTRSGEDLGAMPVAGLVARLTEEISSRAKK